MPSHEKLIAEENGTYVPLNAEVASPHRVTSAANAKRFTLAGNAYLTIRSKKSSTRFTYRVSLADDKRVFFVSYLVGRDNNNNYKYLGIIREGKFSTTRKSAGQLIAGFAPAVAFDYMLRQVSAGRMPDLLEFWHEGKCGRCGRKLTVPESIEAGIGPECASKIGGGQ